MEPPAPAPAVAVAAATAPPFSSTTASVESLESTPRSRKGDCWDEPLSVPTKLRLMCSYGGTIVPRPHDKALCYVGGETRMVVVDRNTSLSSLQQRLSLSLLYGRSFTLKYQLPSEDLDSLISLSTDEDLDNMIDEYDRASRIRLFLFPITSSLPVDASAKSEDWFLNALNRGVSDSAAVNSLLGLDQKSSKQQDVHSVPDSPMVETTSSFGSTSSSPSVTNLPPIRVHVDDQKEKVSGIEEQFAQISVSSGLKQQDEGFSVSGGAEDHQLVHGQPLGLVKPVVAGQPQPPQKSTDLPSPDSVSSDSSTSNPLSRQKPMVYQDQVAHIQSVGANRVLANPQEPKATVPGPTVNPSILAQQHIQEPSFVMQQPQLEHQQQQQQFVHAGAHYIQQHHHHPTGPVPISAYYPVQVYPPQQQHHPSQIEQQYPVYYVPARQTQAYSLQIQQSSNESANTIASTLPQNPSNPTNLPPPAAYNPIRNAPIGKSEMATAAGMYRMGAGGAPQIIQVPAAQLQQQYVNYSQIHNPSQSIAPTPTAAATYAYEYADPAHGQIYYTQPLAPAMPSQYQTINAATAAVLPDASAPRPGDNIKQQIRTSQPNLAHHTQGNINFE